MSYANRVPSEKLRVRSELHVSRKPLDWRFFAHHGRGGNSRGDMACVILIIGAVRVVAGHVRCALDTVLSLKQAPEEAHAAARCHRSRVVVRARRSLSCRSAAHQPHPASRLRAARSIAGHSALVVQAGTVSTRSRGEQPSFPVLRIERPMISVERLVWDPALAVFTAAAASNYRHTHEGWNAAE